MHCMKHVSALYDVRITRRRVLALNLIIISNDPNFYYKLAVCFKIFIIHVRGVWFILRVDVTFEMKVNVIISTRYSKYYEIAFFFFFWVKRSRNIGRIRRDFIWKVHTRRTHVFNETIKPDIKSISFNLPQEAKTDVLFYIYSTLKYQSCVHVGAPHARIRLLIWFVGVKIK